MRRMTRAKSAYNVYYVGINLGALTPIVVGTVGEMYGFHWGFAIAGLGMVVALATYILGGRYLPRPVAACGSSRARDDDS